MPDHLKKVETCHDKHTEKLTVELREAVRAYIEPMEAVLSAWAREEEGE